MKVVLFCGGLGMRIREYSDEIPKPMVPIGYRPVLWISQSGPPARSSAKLDLFAPQRPSPRSVAT